MAKRPDGTDQTRPTTATAIRGSVRACGAASGTAATAQPTSWPGSQSSQTGIWSADMAAATTTMPTERGQRFYLGCGNVSLQLLHTRRTNAVYQGASRLTDGRYGVLLQVGRKSPVTTPPFSRCATRFLNLRECNDLFNLAQLFPIASPARAFGTEISGNRGINDEIKPEIRAAILAAVYTGRAQSDVTTDFSVSRMSVSRILRRFKTNGEIFSRPRSGRPKSLSPRNLRAVIRTIRQDHRITHNQLVSSVPSPIHLQTLQSALNNEGLRKCKARAKIPLDAIAAEARLSFAVKWLADEDELMRVRISEVGGSVVALIPKIDDLFR